MTPPDSPKSTEFIYTTPVRKIQSGLEDIGDSPVAAGSFGTCRASTHGVSIKGAVMTSVGPPVDGKSLLQEHPRDVIRVIPPVTIAHRPDDLHVRTRYA